MALELEKKEVFDAKEHLEAIQSTDLTPFVYLVLLRSSRYAVVSVAYNMNEKRCDLPVTVRSVAARRRLRRQKETLKSVIVDLRRVKQFNYKEKKTLIGYDWIVEGVRRGSGLNPHSSSIDIPSLFTDRELIHEELCKYPEKKKVFDSLHEYIDRNIKKKLTKQLVDYSKAVASGVIPDKMGYDPNHFQIEDVLKDILTYINHTPKYSMYDRWLLQHIKSHPDLVIKVFNIRNLSRDILFDLLRDYQEKFPEIITKGEMDGFIETFEGKGVG